MGEGRGWRSRETKKIHLLNRSLFGKQCPFVYLLNPINTQYKIQCFAPNKNKTEDSFDVWQVECIMKLYPTKQATLCRKI